MKPSELTIIGRPKRYTSNIDLVEAIYQYFKQCEDTQVLPTVSGLCISLAIHRDTLWRYSKDPEFSDTIKRAKQLIEAGYTELLFSEDPNKIRAAVFFFSYIEVLYIINLTI